MSAYPGTIPPDQVYDPMDKPKSGSVLEPHQNRCPIAREITHRLQIPAVVGRYDSVDVGGVCLSEDEFCPESACCSLCSFVRKVRPAGRNGASPRSVHFVLDEFTNGRLRRSMSGGETTLMDAWGTYFRIAVTSGANVFREVAWHQWKPFKLEEHGPEDRILGTLCLWKYQTSSGNLPEPKLDTLTYIAKLAKQWLGHCDARHEVCRSLCLNSTPPISLIDCNQRCLVHGFEGARYVALSYVWGQPGRDFSLPVREYGVPLDGLPRTISDAIAVTKSLDYDYIWVDMLCIDQQSNEDKHRQIAIMDQVYRSADLTIIVAAGSDCGNGIPGVSETCRPPRLTSTIGGIMLVEAKEDAINEIETSIWRSRGWTFQEGLLSRRRLVFTNCQMLFSCVSSQIKEPREGPEFSRNAGEADISESDYLGQREKDKLWDTSFLQTDRAPRTWLIDREPRTRLVGHQDPSYDYGFPISFAELLESYSKLQFSYESDIVDAFRAIGNTFAQRKPLVLHLYGLPFRSDNQSITASSLTRGLAWCLERGNEETARRPGFPSWSWLGYSGPVRWGAKLRRAPMHPVNRQWSAKTFSHVSSMTTIGKRKFDLLELSKWWQEWSSGEGSEGLAPSTLILQGAMIKQEIWSRAECTISMTPLAYIIAGKGAWFPNIEYEVGYNLMMSLDTCRRLLENLRRGEWRALLLTDTFILIVKSVLDSDRAGLYKRVASADIDLIPAKGASYMEMDSFAKKYTNLIEIELD